MQTVVAGWLIFDLTGDAAAVGVLTLLSRGPGMLLSAYGGELADRYERRKLVILLYICQAVPAALLALVRARLGLLQHRAAGRTGRRGRARRDDRTGTVSCDQRSLLLRRHLHGGDAAGVGGRSAP